MRATLFLVACLSMSTCVLANFTAGELGEDDILVSQRNVFKPPIPFKPMMARLAGTAPPCHVISHISVVDLGPATSLSNLIRGAIGTDEVFVLTTGGIGEGLNIMFSVYATNVCPTTTEPDTTTPDVTTGEPSGPPNTEVPTPDAPDAEEPGSDLPSPSEPIEAPSSPDEPNPAPPSSEE